MEKIVIRNTKGPGCLAWLFGLGRIRNSPTVSRLQVMTERKPVQPTAKPPYQYTHPEQIPSQPEYRVVPGGKAHSDYNGQDPRGGRNS